jgi:hypothetical protein
VNLYLRAFLAPLCCAAIGVVLTFVQLRECAHYSMFTELVLL